MEEECLVDQLPDKPISEIQTAKKGKSFLKTVKVVAGGGKHQKNEGPPSDSWSWRKYGQKPIKGSPYPRGYYRCSTLKGCPAKKQVERCRSDASVVLVTYTFTHNHPGPNLHTQNSHIQKLKPVSSLASMHQEPKVQQLELEKQAGNSMDGEEVIGIGDGVTSHIGEHFNFLESPIDDTSHIDHYPFSLDLEGTNDSLDVLYDEEPIYFHPLQTSRKKESSEYDFFDELEELPLSSQLLRSVMTSGFNDERILVQPS